nr:hypothetical protein [Tanacetum cinerariifolium]
MRNLKYSGQPGFFTNQSKYILDILKRFRMENFDTVPTPMAEKGKLKLDLVGKPVDHTDYRSLWYLKDSGFDLTAYSDADHAGCHLDRKILTPMVEQAKLKLDLVGKPVDHTYYRSMIRLLMYVTSSRPDIMFATYSGFDLSAYSDAYHAGCHLDRKTESEYVAVSGCCAQVLWMRTQLTDYGYFYDKVRIYCDSKSAIAISCNTVQHTQTKHIDV